MQVIDAMELQKEAINTNDDIDIESNKTDHNNLRYITISQIPKPLDYRYGTGIVSVTDLYDCQFQNMTKTRRHYQRVRKYTYNDYTWYYMSNHIYVQGPDALRFIRITGIFENPIELGLSPDDTYPIPVDKLGALKQLIFSNELNFMLQRPSDDKNNSSLSGLKPNNNE